MAGPETYSGNGHTATIADPENITRDECLALALCGRGEWNRWREQFPARGGWGEQHKNYANFSEQDFSSEFFDFSEFKFGHGADFSGARFWQVMFNGAEFGDEARFIEFRATEWASFAGAKFRLDACFDRSRFGAETSFEECRFDLRASFVGASFGESLNMQGAVFGDEASFDWALVGLRSSFAGVLFVGSASFVASTIGFESDFSGLLVGGSLSFEAAIFEGQTTFRALSWGALKRKLGINPSSNYLEKLAEKWHASPWVFKAVNFQGVRFEGLVDFSDRHFEGQTDFSETRFETVAPVSTGECLASRVFKELVANEIGRMHLPKGRPVEFAMVPEFFQCKLHQNSSFDGAVFPVAQGTEDAARAYRALKQAFSAQQATREEQRFFRLEMAEETKAALRSHDPAKWLYIAYRELAEFGFSVARPAGLVFIALLIAGALYAWQAGLQPCWLPSETCEMTGPLVQFTFGHALPGFEKFADPAADKLFPEGLGVFTVLTLLLHKAVSVLALFLIGLALRNLFKMK